MESFQALVHKMRLSQRAYSKRHRRKDLIEGGTLEKEVDHILIGQGYSYDESKPEEAPVVDGGPTAEDLGVDPATEPDRVG